ncbi:hypothetical protein [Candidatus Uabimicrobium sp. HlEnr_7]
MEKEIIIVFCICDEITQALKIVEDPQVKMTNSEIMTTALVSMLYFSGNFEKGRNFLATEFIQKVTRKRIETTFSQITSFFPKNIHAVTSYGFELKVVLFVLAFTFSCYF